MRAIKLGKRDQIMITVMLAVSRASRIGVESRVEDARLVFSKDGRDIGSTLIDDDFVSEHAVSMIAVFYQCLS